MELSVHLFLGPGFFSPLRLGRWEAAGLRVTVPSATNTGFTDWMALHLAGSFNHNTLGTHMGCQNAGTLCGTLARDRITDFFKKSRVQYENEDHDEARD